MLGLLLVLFLHGHGHHYGQLKPHHDSCVVFHVGCASTNPPPTHIDWTGRHPVFPG